jgi:hypothetical protein
LLDYSIYLTNILDLLNSAVYESSFAEMFLTVFNAESIVIRALNVLTENKDLSNNEGRLELFNLSLTD